MLSAGAAARYRELAFYWALGILGVQLSLTLFLLLYYESFDVLIGALIPSVALIADSHRKAFRPSKKAPLSKLMNLSFPRMAFAAWGIPATAATIFVFSRSSAMHSGVAIFGLLWLWTLWADVVQNWYALMALALAVERDTMLEIVIVLPPSAYEEKPEATISVHGSNDTLELLGRVGPRLDVRDVTVTSECVQARTRACADEKELRHVGPLLRLSGVRIVGVRGNPAPLLVSGANLYGVA